MRAASLVATLAVPLLLPACAGGAPPQPQPIDHIGVGFPSGKVVNEIEVDAVERLPLRSAELVAPDGTVTPATRLQVTPSPGVSYRQHVSNDLYAGEVFGVANLAPSAPPAAPRSRTDLLVMAATAWITLPDLVAYQHHWRQYRIRLSFGDPPHAETRLLPAPAPPPG